MNRKNESFLRRLINLINQQDGAVIAWSILLIPLMLGVAGLVIDVGYVYLCQRELQISTDAAAMAAAAQLPNPTTATSSGLSFSAEPGEQNAYPNLNTPLALTDTSTTVTPGCVTITGLPDCGGSIAANAVQVTQTTTVPTFFIRALSALGVKTLTSVNLRAYSTAVMRGAEPGSYNVALVLDSTASMQQSDGGLNCTGSKAQCAEQGAQILLSELSPCLSGLKSCGTATNGNVTNAVDEVSLFTFPAQTAGTQTTNDQGCNSKTPSVISYPDSTQYGTLTNLPNTTSLATLVSEYQVAPLSSNYRSSDSTTGTSPLTVAGSGVSSTSPSIVNAVGGNSYFGGTSCTGMQAKGGVSTFYAGAIYTAQQYLEANARPNAQNVIVLLSDGDANGGNMSASSKYLNSNGTYPSAIDQCQQAINVAAAAKQAGTTIYTVGYGVAKGGCSTDSGGLTACSALRQIASGDSDFFVDVSSAQAQCAGATTVKMNGKTNSLSAIFSAIVGDLSLPRLIPNTTTFTPTS
jgi:Putative Flp pilus-assembly TadE/G-like/von Willebrand factor type A domain